MTEKACQPKVCKSKQNGRTRLSVGSVTPSLGIRTLLPHLAEIPGKHRNPGPRTSEQKVKLTLHPSQNNKKNASTMNKSFCLVFNNNLETPLADNNFNFPGCLFFTKQPHFKYISQASPLRRGQPGTPSQAGRQHQAEGWAADVRQVKETEAERSRRAWISSINPSKDALRGPYCVFCDNPTYSAQNYKTGPELRGTLEGHLVQPLIHRRLLFSIIYL